MKQEERIIRVKKPAYAKESGWMTEVPPRKATGKWIKQDYAQEGIQGNSTGSGGLVQVET